uniref:Enhancer of polycomb-like protein n=1 Tax=Bactrocera dorsalis TaxID=27457 RepID=A0A034VY59_BACDO
MSKLSFRARALDPSKQMPIYLAEELPDLPEYSAINRAVPQMPSGMEKEEESEHHLQRAICTGLIIPTPEVFTTDQEAYDRMYPPNYKMPRQLIHMQPLGLEQDVPDYDMDSSDEIWISQQSRRLDLTPLKFEQMMDRLEKSSGQMVVKLNEAKALLKQDDEVSIAVYDYWLNKRLKMQHPLILTVKTENRPGASSNNPYLAFRRRTEKMQTRKNRKNDETSYEKMLKLRRDLQRATTVLEMVKRREKTKREQLHLSIEIFEKRYQLRDFSGALLSELSSSLKSSRPAFAPLYTNQYSHHGSATGTTSGGVVSAGGATHATGVGSVLGPGGLLAAAAGANNVTPGSGGHLYASASQYLNPSTLTIDAINAGANGGGIRKEKRTYKKRKHKLTRDKQQQQQQPHPSSSGATSPRASMAKQTAVATTTPSNKSPSLATTHLPPQQGTGKNATITIRHTMPMHKPTVTTATVQPQAKLPHAAYASPATITAAPMQTASATGGTMQQQHHPQSNYQQVSPVSPLQQHAHQYAQQHQQTPPTHHVPSHSPVSRTSSSGSTTGPLPQLPPRVPSQTSTESLHASPPIGKTRGLPAGPPPAIPPRSGVMARAGSLQVHSSAAAAATSSAASNALTGARNFVRQISASSTPPQYTPQAPPPFVIPKRRTSLSRASSVACTGATGAPQTSSVGAMGGQRPSYGSVNMGMSQQQQPLHTTYQSQQSPQQQQQQQSPGASGANKH